LVKDVYIGGFDRGYNKMVDAMLALKVEGVLTKQQIMAVIDDRDPIAGIGSKCHRNASPLMARSSTSFAHGLGELAHP
jgi:hypothetical protein